MILPCVHESRITEQVQPTVALLNNLDEWHPDVLRQHDIEPADYKGGLVFRSAVESIRGTFIASSTVGRENLVNTVLAELSALGKLAGYERTGATGRYDFTVHVARSPKYFAALEVKGGEGNSINISERPLWADEFDVWCHLDGAIVNAPAHGAHSIVNRVTNELVRRGKVVDALFFRDILCGTRTRPCPKYPGRETTIGPYTAPDIFLLPQRVPSAEDPEPPVHALDDLRLPRMILEMFGVREAEQAVHVWQVHVKLVTPEARKYQRAIEVWHNGEIVDRSVSRSWRV